MEQPAAVLLYPPREDLLAATARRLLEQAAAPPDLTGSVVLLPEALFAADLRHHLLAGARARGHDALLGPEITTVEQWLAAQAPLATEVPGRARRELLLVEAILAHRQVFGDQDPWSLADSLLTLFDELTLHRVPVDASLDDFRRRLQSAYGLTGTTPPEPFDREARIVQRLWQAWHEQLQAHALLDPAAAQLQQLATLRACAEERFLYFVGIDAPHAALAEWIGTVLARGRGQLLLQRPLPGVAPAPVLAPLLAGATLAGSYDDPVGALLDSMLGPCTPPLRVRAQQALAAYPEAPLQDRLHVFRAGSPEQEARAIDLQVRRWLLAGHSPVAIVTEDRRLGRRVRALLERAGILLNDPGGWALSTTRAAAALERWLQTVEEDFAHEPLLDTLKSPFTLPQEDRDRLEHSVFRFETDIVRREQVASGLPRYRRAIDARQERRSHPWSQATAAHLHGLLRQLEAAAAPLQPCLTGEHAPHTLLQRLQESLATLGIWEAFADDPAGQRIQQEWRLLLDAAAGGDLGMDWATFRAWLGSALERHDFRPALDASPVWLLTLQQARLGRFAGIVIGACDSEHLPPAPARAPFFNDRVRTALGLPAWPERHARQLQWFRSLLQGAPRVLLTWHSEQDGEERSPAAWLARLTVFHQLAWQTALEDRELAGLVDHPDTQVAGRHPLARPVRTVAPRVVVREDAIPTDIPVSAHGTLIDCPYRFFAASALQLRAREEVRRELEKAEFGTLVHRALEIFHGGAKDYPAPLPQPLGAAQRSTAIAQLEAVSRQVFGQELEDNFENRAWLRRWLELVEPYVDWLIGHQVEWRFAAGERKGELRLAGGRRLTGRIDRVDSGATGALIIDYKTGRAPDQEAVDSGEAVQLPCYALLLDDMPSGVEHVLLDRNQRPPVKDGSRLEGTALRELSQAVRERLETVLAEIAAGTPLPAWGDDRTCEYCEMDGLCRKAAWPEP